MANTRLITDTIRGMEIVRGTTLTPDEYKEIDLSTLRDETDLDPEDENEIKELEISLSLLGKQIKESTECFLTITNYQHKSMESLSENESALLGNMLKRIHDTLEIKYSKEERNILKDNVVFSVEGFFVGWKPNGNKNNQHQQTTFGKIIDKIYLSIVSVIDIMYELLGRFYRWIKEAIQTNEKMTEKITNGIRYLSIHAKKDRFSTVFSKKEAAYFFLEDKFDIEESLSIYTSLFGLYTNNTTLSKNVNKVLQYKINDNRYLDIEIDTIFPIAKKENSSRKGLYDITGPTLPKGYVIKATLPDNQEFQQMPVDEKTNILNLSDVYIEESKKPVLVKEDRTVEWDKPDLERINQVQVAFSRQCNSIIPYMDMLIGMSSRLRRHKRNLSYLMSSDFNPAYMQYLNANLVMITYISRMVKEPFFSLNKMAQKTNRILLTKLLSFLQTEIKEASK